MYTLFIYIFQYHFILTFSLLLITRRTMTYFTLSVSMASRRSLEERIEIVLLFAKFDNIEEVRRQWKNHFATEAPSRETIRSLMDKFKETGSVEDYERPGRPRSSTKHETVEHVTEVLTQNPQTSIRRGGLMTGMSHTSFHRAAKEANFRPYRPHTVIELSDDDFDRRQEFCATWVPKLKSDPSLLDHIIWSDESQFRLDGTVNRHNCCYWAVSNPHAQIEVPHTPAGVMVWCGLTSTGIIGPFFYDGSVNAQSYLAMLKEFLWPKVKRRRMYFQQDGAAAHYATIVRNWLDEKFANRWIGRRGPFEWPARSPDLSPCDFYLWGCLKDRVYRERPATLGALRERIIAACAEVPVEQCKNACESVTQRFDRCLQSDGKQIKD